MKVYGKKTVITDCEWELEDHPDLKKKLESMDDYELIDFLNSNGKTPIPIRFDLCILSKLSAITALTPNNLVPLAAQSLDDPVPYSFPATITKGMLFSAYSFAAS